MQGLLPAHFEDANILALLLCPRAGSDWATVGLDTPAPPSQMVALRPYFSVEPHDGQILSIY